jgi:Tol biopolymer transport system component
MPWDEDEFRRALDAASARAEPHPEALGRLRGRRHRQRRVRAVGFASAGLAGAAAIALLAVTLVPRTARAPSEQYLGDAEITGLLFRVPSPGATVTAPPSVAPSVASILQANNGSALSAMAGNGRSAAYVSEASNLVPGDTNGVADIFVRDFDLRRTLRVSVGQNGAQANGPSRQPDVSRDGRFIVFVSDATNLFPDTNRFADVFRYDRETGETLLVSVSSGGEQANGASFSPSISADGHRIAFASSASNLVEGDTNGVMDVFVRDAEVGTTQRMSVSTLRRQADAMSFKPAISGDGRDVAFVSSARNLVSDPPVAATDVYVRDLLLGVTSRVSVSSSGDAGNEPSLLPSISDDGNVIGFVSAATNLDVGHAADCTPVAGVRACTQVYVHDVKASTTTLMSTGNIGASPNDDAFSIAVSGDGQVVAFSTEASNLAGPDRNNRRDVYWRHVGGDDKKVVSRATSAEANADSGGPSLSDDGDAVVFQSVASNLVKGDTNALRDVFVRRMHSGLLGRISIGTA